MKPGDKVRIIKDYTGHGVRMGTILTIRKIHEKEHGEKRDTFWVNENGQSYCNDDLQLISMTPKPEKFIITDPSYIMNTRTFHQLIDKENIENSIKEITFPIKTNYSENNNIEITIHKIEETPYGNGECSYEKYEIITDSKTLCIAENPEGWMIETNGAGFKTLEEALAEFPAIIRKF